MRIAHVLSSFHLGGQERVALELSRSLLRRGVEVTAISIAAGEEGPLGAALRDAGASTRTVAKRQGFDVLLPLRLAAALRALRVDVVHTHNPQPLIYGAPAARLAGIRVVHTKHGANPGSARQVALRRLAARLVDAFVAVSPTTATVARRRREVAEAKLSVILNGVDLAAFHPDATARADVRRELGIPDGAWVVGTVGRLAIEKQHLLLVRAAAPLLGENAHLVIVGDGPERATIEALVRQLSAAHFVHLTGVRGDVARCLAGMDLFALSSQSEGLPLVLPEAMATGLPVVSTAVGGIPDVVEEGITGYLVPSGDEAALRSRFAAFKEDREKARLCGEHARSVALDRFSATRMTDEYLAIYRRVAGGGGKT